MERKTSSQRMAEALERARRHWQQHREVPALTPSPETVPPVAFTIAISREAGAQGPAVARAVGDLLNWPVYDQELLHLIAAEMGLREKLISSVDEKYTSWIQECLQAFSSGPEISSGSFVRHLVHVLLSLASHGECVIVGRGAPHVLPEATTLRVRLMGPKAERIRYIEGHFGISHTEATQWIDKTDRDRNRFVQEHFHKDPAQVHHYDLVLNSTRLTVADCAAMIVDGLHRFQKRATPQLVSVG
ncbi:MAG: AAA family ATPase [Gemmataceae bacterium]